MDVKDQKLLSFLLDNSRESITKIAKKIGISKELTHYRMRRLEEDKIIGGYYTLVNYEALGFKRYLFFIQLKQISSTQELEFLEFLNNHPFVTYMGPIIGKWNTAFDIFARDDLHLQKVINEILDGAGNYLDSYLINGVSIHEEVFHHKFFPLTDTDYTSQQPKIKTNYVVDDFDKKLLNILSTNARAEYAYLARKLNMTANAIKYRIKKLEREKIILGYTTSINYDVLGYETYNLQINVLSRIDDALFEFLRQDPNVFFLYKHLGNENWNLDVGIYVKSNIDIRSFLIKLKEDFGSQIKFYDMYIITEVIKDNVAPVGLFQ